MLRPTPHVTTEESTHAARRCPVSVSCEGLHAEACETLTVLDEELAGDRVLGIRFADTAAADEAWSRKRRWWP